jgi:transcription initiation factor TFIIE subunit alpha
VLEILDFKSSLHGIYCRKCNYPLEHDANNNRGGHEQSSKLSKQFGFITSMLPKIDQVLIPENTFEQALAAQRLVIRDATNPAYETAPVGASLEKPTAVRGMANTGPTSIAVTLTTSDGPTEAELAAEKARKAQLAAANALPVHFTHSTVSNEQVVFNANSLPISQSALSDPDKKNLGTPSAIEDGAEIDDYFARLKAEQAKEAEQEQDEEYETDEDEEDESFEDVVPNGTPSGIATPVGVLKKSGSVSGSGTSTGVTSPVTGPGTPVDDGRPAKKVRIEEPSPAPAVKVENEESDEDMEFEDV